jgi:hypothetical protein
MFQALAKRHGQCARVLGESVALRDSWVLRIAGGLLLALGLLSFALRVWLKASSGHALDSYQSGTLVTWNYGSSFVALIAITLIGIGVGIAKWVQWVRRRGER